MTQAIEMAVRWDRWQHTPACQRYLAPQGAAQGYTLLQVPPEGYAAFFALVDLLQARRHLDAVPAREIETAWQAWQTWTRRFAAYLERCAQRKPGTLPPVPLALSTLLGGDHACPR